MVKKYINLAVTLFGYALLCVLHGLSLCNGILCG